MYLLPKRGKHKPLRPSSTKYIKLCTYLTNVQKEINCKEYFLTCTAKKGETSTSSTKYQVHKNKGCTSIRSDTSDKGIVGYPRFLTHRKKCPKIPLDVDVRGFCPDIDRGFMFRCRDIQMHYPYREGPENINQTMRPIYIVRS